MLRRLIVSLSLSLLGGVAFAQTAIPARVTTGCTSEAECVSSVQAANARQNQLSSTWRSMAEPYAGDFVSVGTAYREASIDAKSYSQMLTAFRGGGSMPNLSAGSPDIQQMTMQANAETNYLLSNFFPAGTQQRYSSLITDRDYEPLPLSFDAASGGYAPTPSSGGGGSPTPGGGGTGDGGLDPTGPTPGGGGTGPTNPPDSNPPVGGGDGGSDGGTTDPDTGKPKTLAEVIKGYATTLNIALLAAGGFLLVIVSALHGTRKVKKVVTGDAAKTAKKTKKE